MAGEDTTSSALEPAPLDPLILSSLTPEILNEKAVRVINATWKSGLPQWSWGEGVTFSQKFSIENQLDCSTQINSKSGSRNGAL